MSLLASHEGQPRSTVRVPATASTSAALLAQAGLTPPPLNMHNAQEDSSLVLRSLYPSPQPSVSSAHHYGAFADDQVFRSVAMEMPQEAGLDFDAQSMYQPMKGLSLSGYTQPKGHAFVADSFVPQQAKPDFGKATLHMPFQRNSLHELVEQHAQTVAAPAVASASLPASSSPAPPSMPHWVEPNSHFFVTLVPPTSASMLFETIISALQSLHESDPGSFDSLNPGEAQEVQQQTGRIICTLDCLPAPERFKLTCTAYQSCTGRATPFVVRIFTAAEANTFCVEFQRRQGDVCHFYELYRSARDRVQATHPPTGVSSPAPTHKLKHAASAAASYGASDPLAPPSMLRSWSAPPLPAEVGSSFSKDHICETVRSLLQMCSSPCIDIKLQGVLALAELSCSPSFDDAVKKCNFNLHEVLMAEGCCQLFLSCLPLDHLELHRASMTALANLSATQERLCAEVVGNEKNLDCLYRLCQSNTHQVARECARFFANCARSLGQRLLEKLPQGHRLTFRQVVTQLMSHSDAHCRKHASDISSKTGGMEEKTPISAQ